MKYPACVIGSVVLGNATIGANAVAVKLNPEDSSALVSVTEKIEGVNAMYSASVVIPVYNAEKTLRKCVEALCYGEEQNLEIILIDDCSEDNSWALCRTLTNEYVNVHCYQNKKNSGVSFTRNSGLEKASAPYVLFTDSDDWTSSRYASNLLRSAKENEDALSICGYTYIDKRSDSRHVVCYGDRKRSILEISSLFSLCENVLLQQLWNKVFRRDLIEKHHIRFDESQSMGEDFQFVLDYLEAAQIKKCVVMNEPLYYYIRWNNFSLMSKFGFINTQPEFARMEQLARIVGSGAEQRKETMVTQSRNNYIYHIARSSVHSKEEKLEAIERIMSDGRASTHYRKQRVQFAKERLADQLGQAKCLIHRIKGRIQRVHVQKQIAEVVSGVNAEGITFISQNCIGGVLYHDFGLQFLSPTINAFIPEPGFVKMVLNLRYYMGRELEMHWGEEYPIGTLDDVQIHFMHYDTCEEAKTAWEKRTARINWNRIFVIGTDRDGFDEAVYEQWKQITYPKILFTTHLELTEDAVCFAEYATDGQVGDLIPKRKFYRDGLLVRKIKSFEEKV